MTTETQSHKVKFLCEYGPLIAFGIAYFLYGLIIATAVLVVATVIAVIIAYIVDKKIPMMMTVTAILVAIFGGLTVYLDDPQFIKMKPTIVQAVFAIILLGSAAIKKPLIALFLQKNIQLQATGWMQLTIRLGIFFALMAVLNEYVWRNYDESTWVTFKLAAMPLLTLVFFVSQIGLFKKYSIDS